jgi:hypothetical protein
MGLVPLTSQSQSLSEQGDILRSRQSRLLLDRIKDDTSSLLSTEEFKRFSVQGRAITTGSPRPVTMFDVDRELLGSKVYQITVMSTGQPDVRTDSPLGSYESPFSPSSEKHKRTESSVKLDLQHRRNQVNVLVTGTSGSGKTSFMQLIKVAHGQYTAVERNNFRQSIFANTIEGMRLMLDSMDRPVQDPRKEHHMKGIFQHPSIPENKLIMPRQVGCAIISLWKDPEVQQVFKRMKANRERFPYPNAD